jgi:ADP-ribose pyrophosphatase
MAFELKNSKNVFQGRAFTIRVDTLQLPDGRETRFDIVIHIGSVVIVPMDTKGQLLFVRQYRHAAGSDLLELPAGTLDEGEEPEACARREIREETGMAANKLEAMGGFYLAPGYSTEYMHVYLATDLYSSPLKADADEFLSVERVRLGEALAMCDRGEILDGKTLAALLLARGRLDELI